MLRWLLTSRPDVGFGKRKALASLYFQPENHSFKT
ncbi:hypothetical protein BN8_03979 [Fibrisoma limi BUZ 3]|uniref:Uncharacterized protein n=1 Tax=Fibrisoma limi BUZ 3 TaxID=1185876 RepID=I2GLJ9_9BACT|nr:hypothetical protein BN8_03979 [Fibrisoma limi BUZ 3]